MRLAVIGLGSIGKRHARNALAMGCEVIGYDVNVAAFGDLPKAIECSVQWPEDADAYVIASPAGQHVQQAVHCAQHKAPVLIEKPLALSTRDWTWNNGDSIATLGMVALNWRFHPLVRELRQRISGTVGVNWCEATFWYAGNRATWPGHSYADTLSETSHEIDTAQHLLGPARCVDAVCTGTQWTLTLSHPNGRSTIVLDDHAAIRSRGAQLRFDNGTEDGYRVSSADTGALDASYRDELAHFLRCVSEGALKAPACSLTEGLAVVQICDEARRLAERAA